ncbi:unnamed protein product [Linum trigynum]|uniref:Uncharacterized protein n=1 Tax=Linum trigynum TaxID=586398 RepID=A0AAV2CGU9_9ROSI
MELIQKELDDIKRRVMGLEGMKEEVSMILSILTNKEKAVEVKDGDVLRKDENLCQHTVKEHPVTSLTPYLRRTCMIKKILKNQNKITYTI